MRKEEGRKEVEEESEEEQEERKKRAQSIEENLIARLSLEI